MSRVKLLAAFWAFLVFLSPQSIKAARPLDVVFNEIAWMGNETNYNGEWIELYNNTSSNINLSDWTLETADGGIKINLLGKVLSNGFFLLERADDNAVPEVKANQIYTGSLSNRGEHLRLLYNSNLIDEVNCAEGWFAGDNKTKQTMERKNADKEGSLFQNWRSSSQPNGTPGANNSDGVYLGENNTTKYVSGVILNELLPSPEGPDDKEEWIELFNQNDFEVDLSGWKIQDEAGSSKTFIFPQKTKMPAKGFLLLARPETKITLNNEGDRIFLLFPDGQLADEILYEKAPTGFSFARNLGGWFWTKSLTPGSSNAIKEAGLSQKKVGGSPELEAEQLGVAGVVFNELLPSPEGPDDKEEWIELFNQNDFEVDLSGWKIQDEAGKIKTFIIPKGTIIAPKGFLAFSRSETKITLNNDSDGLVLYSIAGEEVDRVSYQKSPQGQSYNRGDKEWFWSEKITPGTSNAKPPAPLQEEKNGSILGKGTASLALDVPKIPKNFSATITALLISLISAISILTLKRQLKN